MQHEALGEVDNVPAVQPVQTQAYPAARPERSQIHAPALAWGGARWRCQDGIGESRAAQGGAQRFRFPCDVGVIVPVLQYAAAAVAEM
jgi:hypothetical protein